MLFIFDKFVLGMAAMRLMSGLIEFSAAVLMLKFNQVDQALKINAVLAVIGPVVMLLVTSLGIAGLAGKVPLNKLFFIIIGVGFIFYGLTRQ